MNRALRCALMLATGVASTAVWAQDTLEDRITRVEHGLVPAVQIGSGPIWTIEERLAHYRVPGLSIAVINAGKVEWSRYYGVLDARTGEPVTATTLFQVASITKPVTATVALKLVEKGVLDLDRNVNHYLKSWKVPDNDLTGEEHVTLRRLLSHSAGLTVSGFRGYAEGEPVPTIVQVLDGKPPANSAPVRVDITPGSGYRYSGGGYTVLQLLIEDVTGRPLADLADEMIFKPAGMKNSSIAKPLPTSLAAQRASAHDAGMAPFAGHVFLTGGSGCCGLWTTAADLATFGAEMQHALGGDTGAILTPAMAKAMITPTNSENMGLGWQLRRFDGATYLGHGGGNPGFSSYLIVHPTAGYGAAIMVNSNTGGIIMEVLHAIASEYGWEGVKPEAYPSAAALIEKVRAMVRERPADPHVSEGGLNRLGYDLMGSGQRDAALQVFALNVELNPQSSNCLDSLAEAHEDSGDLPAALASYEKAIEILDRYPDKNTGYARFRDKAVNRIQELEKTLAKRQN